MPRQKSERERGGGDVIENDQNKSCGYCHAYAVTLPFSYKSGNYGPAQENVCRTSFSPSPKKLS